MIVIPAIDIIDGSVVRLTKGDYSRVSDYRITPVEAAKRFEDGGLEHLHVVDLDGAEGKGRRNLKTLEKIAAAVSMKIDFGCGVRSADDAAAAFSSGAYAVNIGSMAVKNPEESRKLGEKYPGRIIISAALKSAMTPSFNGLMVLMLGFTFSCMSLAFCPSAIGFPVLLSIAIMLGSSNTISSFWKITVFAVPRSIASSCVKKENPIVR